MHFVHNIVYFNVYRLALLSLLLKVHQCTPKRTYLAYFLSFYKCKCMFVVINITLSEKLQVLFFSNTFHCGILFRLCIS